MSRPGGPKALAGVRHALTLARKESRDILRERTIVMALLTQFFVAAFSAFITVGLVALYDPGSVQASPDMGVAYVGDGGFDAYLEAAENLDVQRMGFDQALRAYHQGDVFAIVEETYLDAGGERAVSLMLPEGEFRTTLFVSQVKDVLHEYERDLRLDRQDRLDQEVIYIESGAQPNIYFGFAYSLLLPLLVATPVFLAGAITGDSINDEIGSKTLLILRSTPLSTTSFLVGKLVAPVLLAPAQVLLWIGLLQVNDLPVANEGLLLLVTFAMALLLAAASSIIAVIVRKEGHVQAAYTVLVLVLGIVSLALPRDPFNLIARLAVGHIDAVALGTIGAYLAAGLATLAVAIHVANQRLHADAL